MTGEKNRFKTTEKLWDLDDKQLKSPEHDAMVLWLMDETNSKDLIHNALINHSDTTWIMLDKKYEIEKPLEDNFNITSESPIMSSKTFIAGYADLIFKVLYRDVLTKHSNSISEEYIKRAKDVTSIDEMISLINEYCNSNKEDMRLFSKDYNCVTFSKQYNRNTMSVDEFNSLKVMDFVGNVLEIKSNFNICEIDSEEIDYEISDWVNGEKDLCLIHGIGGFNLNYNCSCLVEVKPYIDSFGAVLRQIKSYKKFSNYDEYCLFTFDHRFDKQFESQNIKVLHPPEDVTIEKMREMYL